jgi:ribosome-binding ATPase YchF (GTP1/OBG family)
MPEQILIEPNLVAMNKLTLKIENIEDDIQKIHNVMQSQTAESTKIHVQYSTQFRRIEDNLQERFRLISQEIDHLKTVTYPAYWEMKVNEVIDEVYSLKNELREEVSRWKAFRENNFFEHVSIEECIQFVKMSGATMKELGSLLNMDASNVNRMLNGEQRTNDFAARHKIKQYCLELMNKKK